MKRRPKSWPPPGSQIRDRRSGESPVPGSPISDLRSRTDLRGFDMAHASPGAYYVPNGTRWPIMGSFGLFFTVGGAALWLNEIGAGKYLMTLGIATILAMMFGWFRTV